jgi:5-methylcytosine-specific restriction endonuclease McrA
MNAVLLLNASWEPLRVITMRRAVLLVLAEKAEIVTQSDREVRSASLALPAPSVIRLRYFVRVPYRARVPLSRRALVARDAGRCQYCGSHGSTIDHVVPRSRGGGHEWSNVVLACQPCNHRKGDRLLTELGWHLPRKPVAPKVRAHLVIGVAVAPEWEPHLRVTG